MPNVDGENSTLDVYTLIKPGLWLQKITARKPDDSMLEVALVALKGALGKKFTGDSNIIMAEEILK